MKLWVSTLHRHTWTPKYGPHMEQGWRIPHESYRARINPWFYVYIILKFLDWDLFSCRPSLIQKKFRNIRSYIKRRLRVSRGRRIIRTKVEGVTANYAFTFRNRHKGLVSRLVIQKKDRRKP